MCVCIIGICRGRFVGTTHRKASIDSGSIIDDRSNEIEETRGYRKAIPFSD